MKPYEKLISDRKSLSEIGITIFDHKGKSFLLGPDALTIAADALISVGFPKQTEMSVVAENCRKLMINHVPRTHLSDERIITLFNELVLGIVQLPKITYDKLIARARIDLAKVEAIVQKYYALPFVQELRSGIRQNGRNHEEYMIEIFYGRAIKKAREIGEYIEWRATDIAIEHSSKFYVEQLTKDSEDSVCNLIMNYPYLDIIIVNGKLKFEVDLEAIDHELINPYKNKMFVFEFDNDIRITDHGILDSEILDKLDYKQIMISLVEEIQEIPLLHDRKEIFEELQKMANQEIWYGFYALALPQVEGIVAELLRIVGASGGNGKALPQKVGALREFAPNGDFDMDYYQFYLPVKRNKFSHTGKDNEIKTKSFHLLLDLKHLLDTAVGLENNLIILNRMANEGCTSINHIGDLTRIIKLGAKTHKDEHYPQVKQKLDKFIYEDFTKAYDLELLITKLSARFVETLKDFDTKLEIGFFMEGEQPLSFLALSPQETKDNMELIQRAISHSNLFGEAYKVIMDIHVFIAKFPKMFPELPKATLEAFDLFIDEHRQIWVKLRILAAEDRSDIFEDFLMGKKEMMELLNGSKK